VVGLISWWRIEKRERTAVPAPLDDEVMVKPLG
jgi:hypothetical protein